MRFLRLWRRLLARGRQKSARLAGEPHSRRPWHGAQGPQPDILQEFMPTASATIIDLAAHRRLSSGR